MNTTEVIRVPIKVWGLVVALLLIAPTLIVIPLSFTEKRSFVFPPEGWSGQWYERFFTDSTWMGALSTSVTLAVIAAMIATASGTLASLAIARTRGRIFPIARNFLLLPIIVPGIVAAVGILGTYLRWGLNGTFTGILFAHTVLAIPFVIIPVGTAMQGLDPTLEKAAAVLGSSPVRRFFQVQLPLLLPGILTGFVFAFVTSLDEVVISYFLQSPTVRTLPVQMYNSVTVETNPTIAVASTLVLMVSTLIILIPRLVAIHRARHTRRRR